MKNERLDFDDKLRVITNRATKNQLKRLYEQEEEESRLMASLEIFETKLKRTHGISKQEIAQCAGYKSPSSAVPALLRLREKNMINVIPRVHKSIHRTRFYSIPVFSESNFINPTEFIKVSGYDYKKPPHYAIRLDRDRGNLGQLGTLLLIRKCTYAPENSVVAEVGRSLNVFHATEDHRLLGLYDGCIVTTITPFNIG